MNKKVKVGNRGGLFTITDKYYKAAGGEANIYVNGGKVFKVYHDPHKSLPEKKMRELTRILNPLVIIPEDLIYDASTGYPIGYTAKYIDNVEPLLKFFTKTFKQANNIDPAMIAELVKQLQLVTNDVHTAQCLIVDFNELNVLVHTEPAILTPYFIDVDSYATPSYRATAIMDSVRDRRVTSYVGGKLVYKADVESDWFSWAVLTFQLYTNIHPYRGNHPKYKPAEKHKQMDDGLSVFHAGVKVPPIANPFTVIPPRHLGYYKDVFLNGNRGVPPMPDGIAPLTVPTAIVTIKGTNKVDVIQTAAYSENVLSILQIMGVNYVVTAKKVYASDRELMCGCERAKKTLVCSATDGTPIVATLSGDKVTFAELNNQRDIGTISSRNMFARNSCIYTVSGNGKLVENSFTSLGNAVIHRINEIENVSALATKVFDGCVIQDLLGKKFLTLPYGRGACFSKHLPQLDDYRVIDAKSERNVTVVVAEKNGQYDRFIVVFKKDYSDFNVRKVEDIAYDGINFTVMDNGLCLLLANDNQLELFADNQRVDVLEDPPFDTTMKLFNTADGVFFVNGNTIHQIKRK